ncbi:hypothetical protein DPMN_116139 [Dreissena polymorpha]|uniref:Uncharacterized protein n=1 Tax=Dreissena polymorpha TaxID=45954 RepID=A0A9D4KNU3_DREPO|nr:hypothetical protein DPMN_116139 [Dreissena polymorpha]
MGILEVAAEYPKPIDASTIDKSSRKQNFGIITCIKLTNCQPLAETVDGRTNERTNRRSNGRSDERMDGRKKRQRTDARMNEGIMNSTAQYSQETRSAETSDCRTNNQKQV